MYQRTQLSLAAIALGGVAAAQSGVSGSEMSHSPARGTAVAGGKAASDQHVLESTVGVIGASAPVASSGYRLSHGVVAVEAGAAVGPLRVFGVAGGTGAADGDSAATLLGLGLDRFETAPTVLFGEIAATDVHVLSTTQLSLVAPGGSDALGNPLGTVDVCLEDAGSSAAASRAFAFLPILRPVTAANAGASLRLDLQEVPRSGGGGHLAWMAWAPAVDVEPLVVPGLVGAVCVDPTAMQLQTSPVDDAGVAAFELAIPPDPDLLGLELDFQALSLTAAGGSFTNSLRLTVEG